MSVVSGSYLGRKRIEGWGRGACVLFVRQGGRRGPGGGLWVGERRARRRLG